MDEEQWAELLKLREKANLSAKTDYRYQSLEIYLAALHTLNFYSQEERERLAAQLSSLSDQDREDLIYRVTNKTHANLFHLTTEEAEKLDAARKDLQFHERARLLSNLILTRTGTAWLDLGKVFDAQIEIDDNSSPARWSKPYAYIYFPHDYERQVEIVDIFESVNNNPAAIGHPAIVFAIHHWQRVINAKRVVERDDITSRDETLRSIKNIISGELEVENAERNLAALGKNLLRGAKSGAISKEAAFAIKVKLLGLRLEDKNTILYKAWENLESKLIDPTDEVEQVLMKLEIALLAFEKSDHSDTKSRRISAERVMQFLREEGEKGGEEGEKGGKRFVGNNEEGCSLRPSWKIFRNAFAAWYFDLTQSVVQDYLEKAAKENVASDDIYMYSWVLPQSNVFSVFYYLLSNHLVMAHEPVTVHETAVGFRGLEGAIEDAVSGVTEDGEGN